MKILFLTPGCFDKGGISRYSRYQIQALRQIVGENNLRAFSLLGPDHDSFEESFSVAWYAGGNGAVHKIRFVIKVFFTILFWRPDVIHVAHVNFSGFASFLAKVFGKKSVLNVYGLEVWSGLSSDARYGLKNIHHIISDCHFTANYLEDAGWREKGSITVIWDCVDLEKFSPGKTDHSILSKYRIPDPSSNHIIMTLGRLSKTAAHKGFERLIKVFAKVSKKLPNAVLVIAGKGDNKGYYEELVQNMGLEDRVIFTGMVDEADLSGLYRCATVFSLVSDRGKGRGEGIPLTPLEAMACGVPIIVGNQDGSQEAVFDLRNGVVIDPFNLEQHENVLLNILSSSEGVREKKEAARSIAEEYFSYEAFLEKHSQFYSKIG